ncbi:MAG: MFS transporter [Bauldia sp.]
MAAAANIAAPPRATRKEWIGLAVIALPCLLYAMDLTVLNLALPELSVELQPSASELLWIVDVYGFLVAGFLVTMGTLGDRIGRRRLLLFGSAAFGAASVLAAFSTTPTMLIVARALLGIAGATLAPSTLSLIRSMFVDPRQRTFAIGVWIACFSAGGALGPLVGGVLLTYFWWGSVFLIAVPVMVLLLAIGPILLPEYKDPNAGRLDLPSAALSTVAVLGVIYGIKKIAEEGALAAPTVAAIVLGLVVGVVFIRRQRRLADPLVDLSLFRNGAISASLAINAFGTFIFTGTFLFAAQYLQLVLGLSPMEAGLLSLPGSIALAAASVFAPQIFRRLPGWVTIVIGFVLTAVGMIVIAQIAPDGGPWILVAGVVLMGLGFAPVGTLTTDFVVGAAPPEKAGSAAAVSETSFEFGAALGIAILGSLVTALYRSSVAGLLPAGVPPETAEAAEETLGGAVAVAGDLPPAMAADLLAVARVAFTDAVQVAAIASTVIALIGAGLAAARLRGVSAGASQPA